LKLNLGCGFDKRDGYVNLDGFQKCNPDILWDIETFPWPFEDNSFDEILIKHVLEHVGQVFSVFQGVMQEIYRVSAPDAKILIQVPNYKHVTFWADPTHVRAFDQLTFQMMSKTQNDQWIEQGANYTMLAYLMNVDFLLVSTHYVADLFAQQLVKGYPDPAQKLLEMNSTSWNYVQEFSFELRAIK
jgi:SAM-dependent methyltransferase